MVAPKLPLSLSSRAMTVDKFSTYAWMLEHAPVCPGRLYGYPVHLVSRFEDCASILSGDGYARDRSAITGPSRWLRWLPRVYRLSFFSMLNEDGEAHRRLRGLVNKAFTPKVVNDLEQRIEAMSAQLLDQLEREARAGPVDLIARFAQPLPVQVIAEMLGVDGEQRALFATLADMLARGFTGARVLRSLVIDVPRAVAFIEQLIERKRQALDDGLISALVRVEQDGERLSTEELVSMVILLLVAGFETTVSLIANTVVCLSARPDALQAVREQSQLLPGVIEETLRYASPVQATDRIYAREAFSLHGVEVSKGAVVLPLLGAANRDPRAFPEPNTFDIHRSGARHMGFGRGPHFCLGAHLARLEGRVALSALLERAPELKLAVPHEALQLTSTPLVHRYREVPVRVG